MTFGRERVCDLRFIKTLYDFSQLRTHVAVWCFFEEQTKMQFAAACSYGYSGRVPLL